VSIKNKGKTMINEMIQAGEGYRLIDKAADTKRPGDEYWSCFGKWVTASNDGIFHSEHIYRRRIPAKPEAMEIDDELTIKTGDITDQPCLLHREEDKPYWICFGPHECRKLADWLTRYAVWREAQEGKSK
jgi:hypothetical protein